MILCILDSSKRFLMSIFEFTRKKFESLKISKIYIFLENQWEDDSIFLCGQSYRFRRKSHYENRSEKNCIFLQIELIIIGWYYFFIFITSGRVLLELGLMYEIMSFHFNIDVRLFYSSSLLFEINNRLSFNENDLLFTLSNRCVLIGKIIISIRS